MKTSLIGRVVRMFGALLFLGIAIGSLSVDVGAQTKPKPQPQQQNIYSVKYVCNNLAPFPNVVRWTDINIHNPLTKKVQVSKKFLVAGTQEARSTITPKAENFELAANEAISINCGEIANQLNIAPAMPLEGFVEITSKTKLAVVAVYDKCVPDPRTDVFMNSHMEFDLTIDGMSGKAPQGHATLDGPTLIQRGPVQIGAGNKFTEQVQILDMRLNGTLNISGERSLNIPITLVQSPQFPSDGEISGNYDPESNQPGFPAQSFYRVSVVVTSQDSNFRKLFGEQIYNTQAALVRATLSTVPPGAVVNGMNQYKGDEDVLLFSSRSPGKSVGKISNGLHIPVPPPPPPPPPSSIPRAACGSDSIDVEYIQPIVIP